MFALIRELWRYINSKDEYFVLILGLDNAGKTTLLEVTKTKFTSGYKSVDLSKITTTVGLNIGKVAVNGVQLNFWDLGGQNALQSLWDKYFAESHGIVFVVDSMDHARLRESWQAFDKLLDSPALVGVPIVIICNKQDIRGCLSVHEIKTAFSDSLDKLHDRDCSIFGASALLGANVRESMLWLVDRVKQNSQCRPPC